MVEDDILAKVIQFMTHHHNNPMADIEKPIPSDNMEDIANDPFDRVRTSVHLLRPSTRVGSGRVALGRLARNNAYWPLVVILFCAGRFGVLGGLSLEQVLVVVLLVAVVVTMHAMGGDWQAFVDVGQETLFNLISAANFLDIPALLDLTCAKVTFVLFFHVRGRVETKSLP